MGQCNISVENMSVSLHLSNPPLHCYGISDDTARDYMRMYRDSNSLPPKSSGNNTGCYVYKPSESQPDISDYESMTKKELIIELIKAKVAEARLKKGYEVKGDGRTKEYILLDSSNTK